MTRLVWLLVALAAYSEDLTRGQIIDEVKCIDAPSQSYALYVPSNYSIDRAWSVIFAYDPAARGRVAAGHALGIAGKSHTDRRQDLEWSQTSFGSQRHRGVS